MFNSYTNKTYTSSCSFRGLVVSQRAPESRGPGKLSSTAEKHDSRVAPVARFEAVGKCRKKSVRMPVGAEVGGIRKAVVCSESIYNDL